jgi:7-cyano-7-deazaguanine synthase
MRSNGAIVLVSGGLDSATTLYLAKREGYKCFCLAFDYGQRHHRELQSAKRVAAFAKCPIKTIKLDFSWKGSSLLDKKEKLPQASRRLAAGIPSTYVPGRNLVFLSLAASYAEAVGAKAIFIGAHSQDYSGYPDCRPEFFRALKKVITCGTKAGLQNRGIEIKAPLVNKTKAAIIRIGHKLGVPFGLTWSCYRGGKAPCGECDSCYYRARGFKEAKIKDPSIK